MMDGVSYRTMRNIVSRIAILRPFWESGHEAHLLIRGRTMNLRSRLLPCREKAPIAVRFIALNMVNSIKSLYGLDRSSVPYH